MLALVIISLCGGLIASLSFALETRRRADAESVAKQDAQEKEVQAQKLADEKSRTADALATTSMRRTCVPYKRPSTKATSTLLARCSTATYPKPARKTAAASPGICCRTVAASRRACCAGAVTICTGSQSRATASWWLPAGATDWAKSESGTRGRARSPGKVAR